MPHRPPHVPRHASPLLDSLTRLADGLILLLTILMIAIVVTDGWQIDVAGKVVSMRSIGNLLLATALLIAARLSRPDAPLLWRRDATATTLAHDARGALRRLGAWLDAIDRRGAIRILFILAATATAIRLFNIVVHFGFITGDDVEIHEMTIGRVLAREWAVWDLRSPFYPMTFIYPVQRLLAALGVTDVFTLIAAGRLVVATIAAMNIALVYRAGRAMRWTRGDSLLAAGLFALNHLHMAYGSAELPRVVASAFMLGAFAALQRPGWLRAALAGALLAVGACLRFGEMVFVAPALLTLVMWPAASSDRAAATRASVLVRVAAFALAAVATAALALGLSDALYWGEPFHSLRAIVDYTLVRKLSSRGYEPFSYYATHLSAWSDVLLVLLALFSARVGGARPLVWALLPIALLSCLPHKEPRYVIVAIPFLALAAGRTLRVWIDRLTTPRDARDDVRTFARDPRLALCLVLAVAGAALFDASRFRFHRSEDDVRLAWAIADSGQQGIVAEQLWRFGGQLYLAHNAPLIDLDPALPDDDATWRTALCRDDVHWAALQRERLDDARRLVLRACGFGGAPLADPAFSSARYVLYRK